MAVVNSTPENPQGMNQISYPAVEVGETMGSRGEIEEETPMRMIEPIEDKMYVAVGKVVKESEKTLAWALHNSGGRSICILHVHQPAQKIPMMGTKVLISQLQEVQVRAYHENERHDMHKILEKYIWTCERTGAKVEKLLIESDSIEKGIVELISQHGIKKLVMGAAADRQYSRKMMEPKSKKAIYVRIQAPASCHIWFICKGSLIYTRKGRVDERNVGAASPSVQASPSGKSGPYTPLRSRSVSEGQNSQNNDYRRVMSENQRMQTRRFSSSDEAGGLTPQGRVSEYESCYDHDGASMMTPSPASRFSSTSSSDVVDDLSLVSFTTDRSANGVLALRPSSPPSVLQEGSMNDDMYDRIEQAMVEAEKSRRDAYEESIRRRKAEKEAIDAIRRSKASEISYAEELRRRRETEEALARGSQELEKIKQQLHVIKEELQLALEQKSNLETEISNSEQKVQELEEKILSAVDFLQNLRKERDELQLERDNAIRIAEELRREQEEQASSSGGPPQYFNEFTFFEIEEATRNFDPDLKIDEGDYGSIYKGLIHHTQVAIKMLHSHSSQGPSEFQQEVNILSKLRHPNLVTLIGACPESWIIIYEYLPNGSLEDRLVCKDNTPPLSWQTRIRILTELCSVLIFLHSSRPHTITHDNIKPSNILLDSNFVSRLTNFGICCTDEELTTESDMYSFGIIVLRLLTGREASGIVEEVEHALDKGYLNELLDPTAGDWPFVQAKQLAHLAISCCHRDCQIRPDFASEVWRVLEPMGISCGASSFRLGSEDRGQIPHYYICPIFQEVMQDPVVAADGYTYEAEAIKGWLDSGHDTSPMTNLKLPHSNLLPNHALRSAIQESLHQ